MATPDEDGSSASLYSSFIELCLNVINGATAPEDAFTDISTLKGEHPNAPSVLLDALAVVEGEITENEEAKKKFCKMLDLISDLIIPGEILRSELDVLEASLANNKQQIVRMKTRLFFKQSKFNLLREESEGYAKLITEFLWTGQTLSTSALMTRLLSLIGTFNLDPNRVTDIVLEAFEHSSSSRTPAFISLLREMHASSHFLCTLLAFKYSLYKDDDQTPFSLYRITAALVQADLIQLSRIASFMTPKASDMLEAHKARAALSSARSKKAETIFSSNIAVDPHKSANVGSDGLEAGNVVGMSFSAVIAQQELEDSKLRGSDDEESLLGKQQLLGLCCALLEMGEWPLAKQLLDSFPEYYAVQSSRRICLAISKIVDDAIDEVFHLKCLGGYREVALPTYKTSPIKLTSWATFDRVWEVLSYLGPRIACLPSTVTKLVRLAAVFFQERDRKVDGTGDSIANEMMDMVDECLLPSLSLCDSNAALSEEMWQLLRQFHYTQRYRLYGRWKSVHSTRHPEILVEKGKAVGRTKYIIKRLSKDTIRMMGRLIGKLCHSTPASVFDYLLTQVQTFDNFIQPVVDAMRFLTSLEFDILAYCVMEQLAHPSKDALKETDGTTSTWLASLATLVGSLYKKYTVDLAGMLSYIANQLKNDKSFELVILREMIESMTGIETANRATTEHIEAMSGGDLLRQEAGSFLATRNKRATARMREAVLKEGLAAGLAILMAQQRDAVVYKHSENMPLKLAGELTDQCRDTFIQFGSFLIEHIKTDEYAKLMPSTWSLVSELSLPLDAAFFLTRSVHMAQVYAEFDRTKKMMKSGGEGKLDGAQKKSLFNDAMAAKLAALSQQIHPLLQHAIQLETRSPMLTLFWLLTTYDIEVPAAAYDREIEKIRKQIAALPDNLSLGKTKRAKEEERLRSLEQKLLDEEKKQTDHVSRITAFLRTEKDNLFPDKGSFTVQSFLQLCVLPRAIFSESEAVFAGKMLLLLHQNRTSNFQTLLFLDKTFIDLLPMISMLSENEANAFGRFLQIILSQSYLWHSDKSLFEKECEGSPGFMTRTKKKAAGAEKTNNDNGVAYESHAKLLYKWQNRLQNTFAAVLTSPMAEYVHIRNSLVIMNKLLPCFPLVAEMAEQMELLVTEVREREKGKRDDLSLKAASYAGQLKMRRIPIHDENYFYAKKIATIVLRTTPPASASASSEAVNGGGVATPSKKGTANQNGHSSGAKKKRKGDETPSALSSSPALSSPLPPDEKKKKSRHESLQNDDGKLQEDDRRRALKKEEKPESEEGEVPPSPPSSAKKSKVAKDEKEKNGNSASAETDGRLGKKKERDRIKEIEGPALPPAMAKMKIEDREKEKERKEEKERDRRDDKVKDRKEEKEKERKEDKERERKEEKERRDDKEKATKRSMTLEEAIDGKRLKKDKAKEREKDREKSDRIRRHSPISMGRPGTKSPSAERRRPSKVGGRRVHNQIAM